MLEHYFKSETRMRQLRRGPLAEHLDGLAAEFQRASYAKVTVRRVLSICGQFSYFAELVDVSIEDIDETIVKRFLDTELVSDGFCQDGAKGMRHMLRYLRGQGIIGPATPPPPHPFASTLDGFDSYLRSVRSLAPTTRQTCVSSARAFIDWLRVRYGDQALRQLAGSDVLEFITEQVGRRQSRSARGHVCSNQRAFLRYLHTSGTVDTDLARVVPRVSTPRLASLPRGLGWEQVRALIDGVDTSHPDGLRDKAILLLLATLGLRSCEVRSLELRDIAWRAGEIRLPRTKTRRERMLPLLAEVGAALADYVLHGRPAVEIPQVLLRHGPSPGPLASATTLSAYKDALRLLLRFASAKLGKPVDRLDIQNLDCEMVLAFLDFLQRERGNSARTRNARLAVIRSFFRHVASCDPAAVGLAQRILAIGSKRTVTPVVGFLHPPECEALLAAPDLRTTLGRRDHALLLFLLRTGVRASEAIGINAADLSFVAPRQVLIRGKGSKERVVPLAKDLAVILRDLLDERELASRAEAPVFVNARGKRLTRFGVIHIVRRAVKEASRHVPFGIRSISPHTFRHTAAMRLLQAGVDLAVIRAWLGHAMIQTTHQYLEADVEMKRRALEKAGVAPEGRARYEPPSKILALLEG